jgi:hypothetical protein
VKKFQQTHTQPFERLLPLKPHVDRLPVRAHEGSAPFVPSMVIYVHWSPNGGILHMVRRRLRLCRGEGFAGVFIGSADPPAEDWGASKWRLVHRGEIGLSQRLLCAAVLYRMLFGHDKHTGSANAAKREGIVPRHNRPKALRSLPSLMAGSGEWYGPPLTSRRTSPAAIRAGCLGWKTGERVS